MTSAPPLRTDRLTLHPWTEPDVNLLGDLAHTPAVMRYIGDGTTWTDARIADVGAHISEQWRSHGFGWRVARLEGTPIGLIALDFAGEGSGVGASEYEIGWWWRRAHGATSPGAPAAAASRSRCSGSAPIAGGTSSTRRAAARLEQLGQAHQLDPRAAHRLAQ